MKQGSAFVVTEFINPSGQIVFRLYGRLNGQRVRKNFSTRQEAEAEKEVWEIKALQEETGIRAAAIRLTDDQLQEAEAAFTRLKNAAKPLLFYVDYALANYREPQHQKALPEAVNQNDCSSPISCRSFPRKGPHLIAKTVKQLPQVPYA